MSRRRPDRPLPSPSPPRMLHGMAEPLTASPDPIIISATSSLARPDSQPPPRPANPSIVSSVPSRGGPFAHAYNQNFSPKALDARQYYLPPKATPQPVPLAPYQLDVVSPPQRAPSKGKGLKFWKSSAPVKPAPLPTQMQLEPSQFLMPPGMTVPPAEKKKKGFLGSLMPKWGSSPASAPPLPNGRVITNLDDPEPEPEPSYRPPNPNLAPMVPQTPTIYNSTMYSEFSPDDDTATMETRRTTASRVPPPPASTISRRTASRRTGRKVPPPPSTAGVSWVTYAKWRPKRDTTMTGDQSEWTEADLDPEARSTLAAEHFTGGGQSVYTAAPSEYLGMAPSAIETLGSKSLASRPQTPDDDASQRGGPPMPKPSIAPTDTVPSQYAPETPLTEDPPPTDDMTETDGRGTSTVTGASSRRRPRLTRSDNYVSATVTGTDDPGESPVTESAATRSAVTRSGVTRSGITRSAASRSVGTRSARSMGTRSVTRSAATQSVATQSVVTQSVVTQSALMSPSGQTDNESLMSPGVASQSVATPSAIAPTDARETMMTVETQGEGLDSEFGTVGGGLSRTNTVSKFSKTPDTRRLTIANPSTRPSSRISARTGGSRSARSSVRMSVMSGGSKTSRITRSNTKQNRVRPPRAARPFSRRIIDPKKRFSHRPFHYFNRYPPSTINIEPAIANRASGSTNTTRTYIPTRVGRIRRLIQDFVDLPWRGDSDYYGGSRGITATVHFRSRGGGGVSARPQRDSNIPRVAWYRPKQQPGMIDLAAENGIGLAYPGFRTGLNSGPLTDGSERNTGVILPASASPFISPWTMRSPYDTPDSPILQHRASPVKASPLGHLQKSSSTSSGGSQVPKASRRNPHALLDSYNNGVLQPPMPPRAPPSSYPVSMLPDPQRTQPRRGKVPGVPSTAFQSTWTDGREMSMAPGVMVYTPGEEPALYHHPLPGASPPSGIYMPENAPYARQNARALGLPVTIHAGSTIGGSSPRTKARSTRYDNTPMSAGTSYTAEYFTGTMTGGSTGSYASPHAL